MQLLPKKLFLFAVLSICLLISCKKNDSPPASSQLRVKSARDEDAVINYTYDEKWRLIKYDSRSRADSSSREYAYTDTTVTVKNYYGRGIYLGTSVYRLNAGGLATSMTDTASSTYQTYTYNPGNQLLRLQVLRTPAVATYRWDDKYYYNGNGDLDSSTVFASGTGLTTVTYYPQYDVTHLTTLGNENVGLSFLGSSGKHPLKQTTALDGTVLFNFTYTYDTLGRIATQETRIGSAVYTSYSFTYY